MSQLSRFFLRFGLPPVKKCFCRDNVNYVNLCKLELKGSDLWELGGSFKKLIQLAFRHMPAWKPVSRMSRDDLWRLQVIAQPSYVNSRLECWEKLIFKNPPLRWVCNDYFSQHSDLRRHENQFLGHCVTVTTTSTWGRLAPAQELVSNL